MTRSRGFVTVAVLILGLALAVLIAMLARTFSIEMRYISHKGLARASRALAEAGVEKALYEYLHDRDYRGEAAFAFGAGTIDVECVPDVDSPDAFTVRARGVRRFNAREHVTTLEAECRTRTDSDGAEHAAVVAIRIRSSRGRRVPPDGAEAAE